jgi:hypothetical protein
MKFREVSQGFLQTNISLVQKQLFPHQIQHLFMWLSQVPMCLSFGTLEVLGFGDLKQPDGGRKMPLLTPQPTLVHSVTTGHDSGISDQPGQLAISCLPLDGTCDFAVSENVRNVCFIYYCSPCCFF